MTLTWRNIFRMFKRPSQTLVTGEASKAVLLDRASELLGALVQATRIEPDIHICRCSHCATNHILFKRARAVGSSDRKQQQNDKMATMNFLESCSLDSYNAHSFDTPSSALSRDSRHKLKAKNGCQKFISRSMKKSVQRNRKGTKVQKHRKKHFMGCQCFQSQQEYNDHNIFLILW